MHTLLDGSYTDRARGQLHFSINQIPPRARPRRGRVSVLFRDRPITDLEREIGSGRCGDPHRRATHGGLERTLRRAQRVVVGVGQHAHVEVVHHLIDVLQSAVQLVGAQPVEVDGPTAVPAQNVLHRGVYCVGGRGTGQHQRGVHIGEQFSESRLGMPD